MASVFLNTEFLELLAIVEKKDKGMPAESRLTKIKFICYNGGRVRSLLQYCSRSSQFFCDLLAVLSNFLELILTLDSIYI